jgi:Ni2+-binding GTPase involved in maturation of urease and hydrogenase
VPFDIDIARENALHINPDLAFLELSALKGRGLDEWFAFLRHVVARAPVRT